MAEQTGKIRLPGREFGQHRPPVQMLAHGRDWTASHHIARSVMIMRIRLAVSS
ncbi:MAG: hypothetical protein AB8B85_11185 [Paracoccaceae bacterium]